MLKETKGFGIQEGSTGHAPRRDSTAPRARRTKTFATSFLTMASSFAHFAACALAVLSGSTHAQTWDTEDQSFDRNLAREMAIMSEKVYSFPPNLSDTNYALVGTYSEGNDHALLAQGVDACVVAFRGSESLADWVSNVLVTWGDFNADLGYGDLMAWSHTGFMGGYRSLRYTGSGNNRRRSQLLEDTRNCLAQNNNANKLYTVGHSRGASLASHMAIHFGLDASLDDGGFSLSRLRTSRSPFNVNWSYGEPRMLAPGFSNNPWTAVHNILKYRFVYNKDLACGVPPNTGLTRYNHWGAAYLLNGTSAPRQVDNDYPTSSNQTGSADDHSLVNYISALS
jgi:hypothetical protein